MQGRETPHKVPFTAPDWSMKLAEEDFNHCNPNVYTESENFWYLELGGDRDAIGDTEEVARDLISLSLGTWDHIKNSGHHNADNPRRAYHIPVEQDHITALRLIPLENWGGTEETDVFSFDFR